VCRGASQAAVLSSRRKDRMPVNIRRSLLRYSLTAPLVVIPAAVVVMAPDLAQAAADAQLGGVVRDAKTKEKIAGALVYLQCSCLQGQRETTTSEDGIYTFRNLPQGKYTVQVLYTKANVSKSLDLPAGSKFRADFAIDPGNDFTIVGSSSTRSNVLEAGYDAEYGGATGGQIRARRIGGSNKLRGVVVMRVAPRLAAPRLIAATDEALRVAEIAELDAQAVVQISGPIVRDKLFFSVGVAPGGQRNSMIQSFHRRRDKDRDGGYEGCAYENGTSDCAANGNYIDTVKFAEQKFRTGRVDIQASGTLDWQITPKHACASPAAPARSASGAPASACPPAPSPAPSAPTRRRPSAASRASARASSTTPSAPATSATSGVGLDYEGRVNSDKLEIDASAFYSRFQQRRRLAPRRPQAQEAPRCCSRPTPRASNLYDLLDRDGATRLVPGVDGACNNSRLPGLTCPTRTWLSGGLGNYSSYTQDRGGGLFSLTHFLTSRRGGSHQIKYGAEIDNVRFRQNTAYSGSNPADFYNNCPAGPAGRRRVLLRPGRPHKLHHQRRQRPRRQPPQRHRRRRQPRHPHHATATAGCAPSRTTSARSPRRSAPASACPPTTPPSPPRTTASSCRTAGPSCRTSTSTLAPAGSCRTCVTCSAAATSSSGTTSPRASASPTTGPTRARAASTPATGGSSASSRCCSTAALSAASSTSPAPTATPTAAPRPPAASRAATPPACRPSIASTPTRAPRASARAPWSRACAACTPSNSRSATSRRCIEDLVVGVNWLHRTSAAPSRTSRPTAASTT
jgi:hypothetical protein